MPSGRLTAFRVWVAVAACVAAGGCQRHDAPVARAPKGAAGAIAVTRPTVIAYFVIPAGAVDTLPDLAVEADDWNVAMASLGDSLAANGIGFTTVTEPQVRLAVQGQNDTTLALGAFRASGYVFAAPRGRVCVRPGGADPDSVKSFARAYASAAGANGCA